MAVNQVGRFVSNDGVNATYWYNETPYDSFVLVDFRTKTTEAQLKLSAIPGVSNCSRELSTGYLAFRAYEYTVFNYIAKQEGELLISNGFRYQDQLKIILRNATQVILCCYREGFAIDITHIYVVGLQYPRVKAIPSGGDVVVSFTALKENLIKFYHQINAACIAKYNSAASDSGFSTSSDSVPWDVEFGLFVDQLEECNDIRAVEELVNSSFFWTKTMRLNLIAQFNEVIKRKPPNFKTLFNTTRLRNWQNTMDVDEKIRNIVRNSGKPSTDAQKIDNFLLFLRTNVSHFSTQAGKSFQSAEEFLVHLENRYSSIMGDLYKGIGGLIRCGKLEVSFKSME